MISFILRMLNPTYLLLMLKNIKEKRINKLWRLFHKKI